MSAKLAHSKFLGILWNVLLMFHFQYLHYTISVSGITHYVSKYHSKYLFNALWNSSWSKRSMELSLEFHGTFWTAFEQHPWLHGIPWNLSNKTSCSMEFHGFLSRSKVPWNSMELLTFPKKVPWNSMEFYGTILKFNGIPWNSMELDEFDI